MGGNMALPATQGLRATDDEARTMAQGILAGSRHAALATLVPDASGVPPQPMVTRVAIAPGAGGLPLMLLSSLSMHSKALRADPALSLLLGDVVARGDPLTQPRLTLQGRARFLVPSGTERAALRARWLVHQPKALVYVDLPDFSFVTLDLDQAFLNGGFGRAYHLDPADLT